VRHVNSKQPVAHKVWAQVLQSYIIRSDSFYCHAHSDIMKVEIIGNLFQCVAMHNMSPGYENIPFVFVIRDL
jgi:hypothetical protein